MAAWPAKPAATDVVAHATLKECCRRVLSAVGPLKPAKNATRDLFKNLMNFSAVFSECSQRPNWNG